VSEILLNRGIASVAWDMAKGVNHLHSEGTVHRDIAARNFLADKDGKVVVSDFGLSRKLGELEGGGSNDEEQVYHMSKPHDRLPVRWMAPETLPTQNGSLGTCDKRTDVWSFGVTLWELAHYCLLLPYRSMDNPTVMKGIVEGKISLEFDLSVTEVSEEFRKLVKQCMSFAPEKRPSMEEVVDTLGKMASSSTSSSSSSSSSSSDSSSSSSSSVEGLTSSISTMTLDGSKT